MDQEVGQVVQAIIVASDPTQAALHQQALQFLSNVESNPNQSWRLGLALFVESNVDGSRKYPAQARFFGLRLLEAFLDNRFEPLDNDTFQSLQKALIAYIQSEYVSGMAESSAAFLRNKFSHILTLFFLCTYLDQWPSFFSDLFALIRRQEAQSTSRASEFNPHVSMLFFHLVLEISGEVADQVLKSARSFNGTRHARDGKVRDAVRERDAAAINEAVLTIVADGAENMGQARKGDSSASIELLSEVVDWGVRTFGSYVGWIDINLTVTPTTIPLLFSLLSDPSLPIRLATCGSLLRMVGKGLKEPSDKLQLFKVLSLDQVIAALEEKTRQDQKARGDDTDEGEETYREALGRLLNGLGLELVKLIDEAGDREAVRTEASNELDKLRPTVLHFLADPYDDTCSTIFPLLSSILVTLKRAKRSTPEAITHSTREFLASGLSNILEKMKWDEDQDPDDMDDDDKRAFEQFRKGDLRVHLDSISVIEPDLVNSTIQTLVMNTLAAYRSGSQLKWNDAELAIYLVYIFGDVNKSGKGRAAFCQAPEAVKERRKQADYSEYALTPFGEMLYTMVQCGISSYPHDAVSMQFFESCARYGDFFKVRKECIIPLLEAMVGPRGVHHPSPSSRSRVYYLLYKFLKEDRNEISAELAVTLLNGLQNKLGIQVELPEVETPEQDMLTEAVTNPGVFESQLYLFETAGILISLTFRKPQESEVHLLGIVQPLLDELSVSVQAIKSAQDYVPILKVHHIIMALGNLAKGFPDLPTPPPQNYILPPIAVFRQMTQAIIVVLEALNVFKVVREAARFAFGRIVATAGSTVIDFIPTLMSHLLAHFEPTELVEFLTFIGLLMHRLQMKIFDVVDQLASPLHSRIMELLASPVTGTDDNIIHMETKKGYLSFVNNVLSNGLDGVFVSEGNKAWLEALLAYVLRVAADTSDPGSQRLAITLLGRCVTAWGQTEDQAVSLNGKDSKKQRNTVPGFERFIYESVLPLTLQVPSSTSFNIKDGQMLVVLHEIATTLQTIRRVRGTECDEYLIRVFFPSQNWPPEAATDFVIKLGELDPKNFRKYFTDSVRASKQSS